jgi:hypothetical protein
VGASPGEDFDIRDLIDAKFQWVKIEKIDVVFVKRKNAAFIFHVRDPFSHETLCQQHGL